MSEVFIPHPLDRRASAAEAVTFRFFFRHG